MQRIFEHCTLYTWDEASRLTSVSDVTNNGTQVNSKYEFVYDGMSRLRISRTYVRNSNNVLVLQNEKRRVYDGMEIVQERDGTNVVTASLTRTGNIGGILARTTQAGSVFYNYDGSGNVVTLTDRSGAEVGSYNYDAFGNSLSQSGVAADANPYRFSTKESIAGMYSYGFRFYSPGSGRFINRDPIGEAGGTNLYGFVGNNPVNMVDLYGLDWLDNASNFSAGAGDFISFGGTTLVRQGLGVNDVVDTGSGAYVGGAISGAILVTVIVPERAAGAGAQAVAQRLVIKQAIKVVGRRTIAGAATGAATGFVSEGATQGSSYLGGDGVNTTALGQSTFTGAVSGAAVGAIGAPKRVSGLAGALAKGFIKDQLKRAQTNPDGSSREVVFCKAK